MPQILEGSWLTDLHTFWVSIAKITFDHFLIFMRVKEATIGAGQCAEKAADTLFVVDGNDSRLRIFMDRSGRTNIEAIGFITLDADDRTEIGFFKILDGPYPRTSRILGLSFYSGTGLFTIQTVVTFLRIDGQLIKDRFQFYLQFWYINLLPISKGFSKNSFFSLPRGIRRR